MHCLEKKAILPGAETEPKGKRQGLWPCSKDSPWHGPK